MAHAGYNNVRPKCRSDFRTMTVGVALERAIHAQNTAKSHGSNCRGKRKKRVWMDCDKLIANTVLQLNRTLDGVKDNGPDWTNQTFCADVDAQTWLSTALTNIETCRAGAVELNVSGVIEPIVSSNVSELISNCLAVNGVLIDEHNSTATDDDEFPIWISAGERRLLQSSSVASQAKYVVSKKGRGDFRSIQAAINQATSRRRGNERIVIYIKRGVYRENVIISSKMSGIMLVGDGLRYTIITGARSVGGGYTTYSSATFGVDGPGFIARGITFRNTAGPGKGQAVALRSASDLSVFYSCGFEGYQDTLFVLAQRQFYKSCYIYGTIDFIFGNAAAVFQNCLIYVRKPLWGQINVVTAQGRGDPFQNTGISIHNSQIRAAPDLEPVARFYQTYLGRPWQQYSQTVVLKSYIDRLVNPQGWLRWQNSDFALSTLYYGEYRNFGPGASTRLRVKWAGYHVITSRNVASRFTVSSLIAGRTWLPSTGVPFTAGL
ncbi:probable pectinesterase/pectinesterase inhibitor 33 [Ipomoea triloba]|uniref:probable pectinesterase/pectinesterase inhibitor 33 n=1 Tax=Ipomoea triloba TaxID=35885 RepID=UPI00125D37F6|nr:probable pectinesterase/pectinesterase inhibitor 33 [Ipomoea triloba]